MAKFLVDGLSTLIEWEFGYSWLGIEGECESYKVSILYLGKRVNKSISYVVMMGCFRR